MRAQTKPTVTWLAAIALLLGLTLQGRAQGIDQIGSLKLVPADASFYSSSLRMKEQLDIVLKSNAWAKLVSLPAVQQGLQMMHAQMQSNPQAGMAMGMLEQPENKQLLKLLGDMISNEAFVYGDSTWGAVVKALSEANSANQFAPLSSLMAGGNPENSQIAQLRGVLRTFMKNRAELRANSGRRVQGYGRSRGKKSSVGAPRGTPQGLPVPRTSLAQDARHENDWWRQVSDVRSGRPA